MTSSYDSALAKKLNLKGGMTVRVVGAPDGLDLSGLASTSSTAADGVLVFVRDLAEADRHAPAVVEAASAGRLAWMAYPKARQLGTDLNRDILWKAMRKHGIDPNRQISIDATWSAMRFRAAKPNS